jgi:membrane protease YdiL (CAAX protease family)
MSNAKRSPAWILALLSIIFGAIGSGLVGLILGIIALVEKPNENERTMAIVGIILSVALSWVWWVWRKW